MISFCFSPENSYSTKAKFSVILHAILYVGFHISCCSSFSLNSPSTIQEKQWSTASSFSTDPPRPLQQNWWPVVLANTLDPTKPNSVELLGGKLVLWYNGDTWSCLDDFCAHRFAPLSEGRVICDQISPPSSDGEQQKNKPSRNCLQCAYHGWEFTSDGGCIRIPQAHLGHGRTTNSAHFTFIKASCGR